MCNLSLHDPARNDIYTLSLHDALPISLFSLIGTQIEGVAGMSKAERTKEEQWEWATQLGSMPKLETLGVLVPGVFGYAIDRKSTRLNSSHSQISYAVFCLKKNIDVDRC